MGGVYLPGVHIDWGGFVVLVLFPVAAGGYLFVWRRYGRRLSVVSSRVYPFSPRVRGSVGGCEGLAGVCLFFVVLLALSRFLAVRKKIFHSQTSVEMVVTKGVGACVSSASC